LGCMAGPTSLPPGSQGPCERVRPSPEGGPDPGLRVRPRPGRVSRVRSSWLPAWLPTSPHRRPGPRLQNPERWRCGRDWTGRDRNL
jgi:hypothetical protein